MISKEESYDLFLTTLARLDKEKLKLNDEFLSYEIFDELDIESISFLHERTVNRLIEEGLIPTSIKHRILNLRESIIKVMEYKHTIDQYRNDWEWTEVREEANNLIKEIKTFANKT